MTKKNRKDIKDSKNVVENTKVKAGKKVHIGDNVTNIYTNETGKENLYSLKEGKKGIWKFLGSAIVFVSITLIGISIKECNFLPIELNFPKQDIEKAEPKEPEIEASNPKEEKTGKKKPESVSSIPKESKPLNPKLNLTDFIDLGESPEIALLGSDNGRLNNFRNAIIDRLQSENISFSSTFFQAQFEMKFGSKIQNLNMAGLRKIGLIEVLNCICQIEENITVESGEIAGSKMYTARGNIKIFILNLKTGKQKVIPIFPIANGAGISEDAALKSLEERFFKSDKLKSINININNCK